MGYHNLSKTRQLSLEESTILALGLNFIPVPPPTCDTDLLDSYYAFQRKVRIQKSLLSGESSFNLTHNTLPFARRAPSSFVPTPASSPIEQYLEDSLQKLRTALLTHPVENYRQVVPIYPSYFKKTIMSLRADKEIIISPSDKNLGLCIIDRTWYFESAYQHLHNARSYKELTITPIYRDIFQKLKAILKDFSCLYHEDGSKFTRLASYLLTMDENPTVRLCKFYLLIKIHKEPISSRPICSNTNYITWHASKYLDFILKPFMQSASSYVKNSQSLIAFLDKKRFPSTCILLEADVDNLYPSIPIQDGLRRLEAFLILKAMPVKQVDFLVTLARWVLENNFCTFDDHTFQQTHGTAMGTPFAVVYACIYLTSIENEVISSITARSDYPLLFKRFIDDIVGVFLTEAAALNFIGRFNSISPDIHLTAKSSSTAVHFLDITLLKGERFTGYGILDIQLFQKPINKYVYIPPTSFHSKRTFRGIVLGELRRYRINCSNDADFESAKRLFHDRLVARGHCALELAAVFETVFDRVSLLHTISNVSKTSCNDLNNPIFISTRSPRTLALNLKDCFQYPEYLFNDIHSSLIFSGRAPVISYRSTPNISSLIANRL